MDMYVVRIKQDDRIMLELEVKAFDYGVAELYIDSVLNNLFDNGYLKEWYTTVDLKEEEDD